MWTRTLTTLISTMGGWIGKDERACGVRVFRDCPGRIPRTRTQRLVLRSAGLRRRPISSHYWRCSPDNGACILGHAAGLPAMYRPGGIWGALVQGQTSYPACGDPVFRDCIDAPIPKIAVENPIGIMSSRYRKPDQIIQPWQFGHGETKATCLWLKGLPKLVPTDIVEGREARVHRMPPGPDRWKERSRTFTGIAQAMAEQWG